ncbi:MAG TPA: TonB-dependent receptor, partial [Candidatus Methylomirabilis sp.]|nr:TonB-dependent receptor [Candidatus Methylomirabilis sp.]
YTRAQSSQENAGVGGFTLPSQAYALSETVQTVQLTETALLTPSAVNETRLQFIRSDTGRRAASFQPAIQVLESFVDGGAQVGNSMHSPDTWELQNNTTVTRGTHTFRFGGRVRMLSLYDRSPRNFGGTFVFSGGSGPELDSSNHMVIGPDGLPVIVPVSSIERYRRTLLFQQLGYGPAEVRVLGGGASQFSRAGGRPVSSLTDTDLGLFVQDDWRMTPTLSLSAGLRWEGQSDIHDWKDLAPRLGLAWMPGNHGGKGGKTVIRLGAGVFYDRFGDNQMLQTLRFDGHTQRQFVLNIPSFFPQVPSIPTLETLGLPQTIRQVDPNLRSAYLIQSALGIERQLPMGMVAAFTVIDTRARHLYLSRNITAPYPGDGVA